MTETKPTIPNPTAPLSTLASWKLGRCALALEEAELLARHAAALLEELSAEGVVPAFASSALEAPRSALRVTLEELAAVVGLRFEGVQR